MREEDFIGRLVQDTGDSQDQQRPGIGKHPPHQGAVEAIGDAFELFRKKEGDGRRTKQVDIEDVTHIERGHRTQFGQHHEIDQVQRDVQENEQQLQGGKLNGLFLIPEVREQDGLEGVQGHGGRHRPHKGGMAGIPHAPADRAQESQNKTGKERRRRAHHAKDGREHLSGIFPFLVRKSEERGFHPVGQDDQQQGGIGIQLGHHPISAAGGRNLIGI